MRLNNLNIKRFIYLLVASFVLCAACEPTSKPADEPVEQSSVLTLSTQEISVSPEGEEVTISYTLENAKEGVKLSAECEAAWISDIIIDAEKITLQVAENEDDEREAVVVISYDTIVEQVRIVQGGFEGLNFEATIFSGDFYHMESLYWNAHNYYFTLSDAVIDRTNPVPNSTYFYFDLYTEIETEDHSIPCGTYTLDPESQWLAGTLNGGKTYGFTINARGDDYAKRYLFTEGEVVVSERKIEAEFVCEDGTKVRVSYEGDHTTTPHYAEKNDYLSTLSGDVNLDLQGATVSANYYGDYFTEDSDNWTVRIYEDANRLNGLFIQLELLADPNRSDWQYLYTALQDNSLSNPEDYLDTYIKGYISEGNIAGSWYAVLKDGAINYEMAPIMDGSVDIVLNDDGTTSFTFDCVDDAGHKIKGTIAEAAN